MNNLECPYCGQSDVWIVSIPGLAISEGPYTMCFECNTVWSEGKEPDHRTGKTVATLTDEFGRTPNWKEIVKLKPLYDC